MRIMKLIGSRKMKPVKQMRVYISGPITGIKNFESNFAEAEKFLKSNGCAVINPARLNTVLPEGLGYQEYMKLDFALVDMADALYMLPNWSSSKGARAECNYAEVLGKKIIYPGTEGSFFVTGGKA